MVLFSSVFLTILQIFSPEVTLNRDRVLIIVGAYKPKSSISSVDVNLHGPIPMFQLKNYVYSIKFLWSCDTKNCLYFEHILHVVF